jgi:hypothetical protein
MCTFIVMLLEIISLDVCEIHTHDIFQRQAGDISVPLNHVSAYFGSSHHLNKWMSRHLTVIK